MHSLPVTGINKVWHESMSSQIGTLHTSTSLSHDTKSLLTPPKCLSPLSHCQCLSPRPLKTTQMILRFLIFLLSLSSLFIKMTKWQIVILAK